MVQYFHGIVSRTTGKGGERGQKKEKVINDTRRGSIIVSASCRAGEVAVVAAAVPKCKDRAPDTDLDTGLGRQRRDPMPPMMKRCILARAVVSILVSLNGAQLPGWIVPLGAAEWHREGVRSRGSSPGRVHAVADAESCMLALLATVSPGCQGRD